MTADCRLQIHGLPIGRLPIGLPIGRLAIGLPTGRLAIGLSIGNRIVNRDSALGNRQSTILNPSISNRQSSIQSSLGNPSLGSLSFDNPSFGSLQSAIGNRTWVS